MLFGEPATSLEYGTEAINIIVIPINPAIKNTLRDAFLKLNSIAVLSLALYLLTSRDNATGKAPKTIAKIGRYKLYATAKYPLPTAPINAVNGIL